MLASPLLALWLAAAPPFLSWGRAPAADRAQLQARQAEASRLMGWYGYHYAQWSVHELRCPLLRQAKIFKLLATDAQQEVSEVVLILPGGDGPLALIPVSYDGNDAAAALDLHNVAIFNALIAAESGPAPATPAQWIELGELYLNLIGDLPQLVTADRRSLAPQAPLPSVEPRPGGGAQVTFVGVAGVHELVRWQFSFDARGYLRALRRSSV